MNTLQNNNVICNSTAESRIPDLQKLSNESYLGSVNQPPKQETVSLLLNKFIKLKQYNVLKALSC